MIKWFRSLLSAPSLDALDIAHQDGFLGYQNRAVCPYPHGPLGDAWRGGWDQAEAWVRSAW